MALTTHNLTPPATFSQWCAAVLKSAAGHLDADTIDADAVRAEQRRLTEIALLNAEQEQERYHHTVQMLRERLKRLQKP